MRASIIFIMVLLPFTIVACQQTIPKSALELKHDSFETRQLQTRSYDSRDERTLLKAGAGVLQDLGFSIDESEMSLGVVVGSKDRDATEAGQIAGAILMAVMFGVQTAVDKDQKIRASLVTRAVGTKTNVRVTFQRIVWNNHGQVSKTESIEDASIYQEFFAKLSKSVFLEANEI